MQEIEKILEEIDIKIAGSMGKKREGLLEAREIIRKHMNEKVTTNDLISRQTLLDDFRNTITENSDTFDWLNMIARQPAVKKDDDWIPVEKYGLPKDEGVYDLTIINGLEEYVSVRWQFLSGTHLSGTQHYVDGVHYWADNYRGDPINEFLSERVIAWRKKPEPYQPERSDNHDGE